MTGIDISKRFIRARGYFQRIRGDVEEWVFSALPKEDYAKVRKFKIPRFTRRISEWLNLLIQTGFNIERLAEPKPSNKAVTQYLNLQAAQVLSYFLIVLVRCSS